MPISKIEVKQYECVKCGHKWINWINGQDGPRPRRCSKCKRWDWDTGYVYGYEKDLRRKLIQIEREKPYKNFGFQGDNEINPICWNFLYNTDPKPTESELCQVIGNDYRDIIVKFENDKDKLAKMTEKRHERMIKIMETKYDRGYDWNAMKYHENNFSEYFNSLPRKPNPTKEDLDKIPLYRDWLRLKQARELVQMSEEK